MSSSSYETRVALITGASSGIGRTSAIALARSAAQGPRAIRWQLVLSGRRLSELEQTAQLVCAAAREAGWSEEQVQQGRDTLCVVGDVSKQENVKELFEKVKEKFGESKRAPCDASARESGKEAEGGCLSWLLQKLARHVRTAGGFGGSGNCARGDQVAK